MYPSRQQSLVHINFQLQASTWGQFGLALHILFKLVPAHIEITVKVMSLAASLKPCKHLNLNSVKMLMHGHLHMLDTSSLDTCMKAPMTTWTRPVPPKRFEVYQAIGMIYMNVPIQIDAFTILCIDLRCGTDHFRYPATRFTRLDQF